MSIRIKGMAVLLSLPVALIMFAGEARADINGTCEGSAQFLKGTENSGPFEIVAKTIGSKTVVIPRSDTVNWKGSVAGPPGEYSGSVKLDLPMFLPDITIDTWDGKSDTTSNTGNKDYDIPGIVPGGVTFQVKGEHSDANGTCTGFVNVKVEGGAFGSLFTYVSLGLTVVSGFGLLMAVRPLLRLGIR